MAFIEMIDAGSDSHRPQGSNAPDAHYQLLPRSGAVVAAVKARGQLAVFGAVAVDVAIQQIQVHAADPHQPNLGKQAACPRLQFHGDRLAVGSAGRLQRKVFHLGVEVFLGLPTVGIEMLLEIALIVEQPYGYQRHAQPAGTLDMIAGKDPEAPGIDRDRLVNAELHGEIGYRLGSEHPGVGRWPRRGLRPDTP